MKYIKLFERGETNQYNMEKSYNKLYDAFYDFLETEGNYELTNDYFTAPVGGMMDMLKIMGKKTIGIEPTRVLIPSPTIKFWKISNLYTLEKLKLQFLEPVEMMNFLVEKIKHLLQKDYQSIYIENKNFSYLLECENIDKATEIIKNLNAEDFEDWKIAKKYNL